VITPLTAEELMDLRNLWLEYDARYRAAKRDYNAAKARVLQHQGNDDVDIILRERAEGERDGLKFFLLLTDHNARTVRMMVQLTSHAEGLSQLNDKLAELTSQLNVPKLKQLQTTYGNMTKEMQTQIQILQQTALEPGAVPATKMAQVEQFRKALSEMATSKRPPPNDAAVVKLDGELARLPAPSLKKDAKKATRKKERVPVLTS
jgi:hypothetical protein